jgi:hypothetical protein
MGMHWPNAERAVVDEIKVRDYLLSREHPVGRYKAVFFARLGYAAGHWGRLRADLRAAARSTDVRLIESTAYGKKCLARGILTGPAGVYAEVVTVWIVTSGGDVPRLITAYPGEKLPTPEKGG